MWIMLNHKPHNSSFISTTVSHKSLMSVESQCESPWIKQLMNLLFKIILFVNIASSASSKSYVFPSLSLSGNTLIVFLGVTSPTRVHLRLIVSLGIEK